MLASRERREGCPVRLQRQVMWQQGASPKGQKKVRSTFAGAFQARHDAWSFEVADHKGELPSDGCADEDGFYRQGAYEKASYMPFDVAMRIIDRCLREYLDGEPGFRAGG